MRKEKKNKSILINNIEIIDTANKGKSVGKHEGRTIFVQGGVPGDICDVVVFKKRRKFWQANIKKVHHYSKRRTEAKCEHFGVCGGCKWQNMDYKSQLYFKQNEVLNNLKKIGSIKLPEHSQIIGSEEKYFYRNKMEFTFSNKRWLSSEEIKSKKAISNKNGLGLHVPGMFDKIVDLNNCYLQKEPSNTIRLAIKEFIDHNNLSYFDIKANRGLLRNLIIKTTSKNELMVIIQFFENQKENISIIMEHLKNKFPEITSLLYIINKKRNNTIYDQEVICYNGQPYITEEIDGLQFKIGPKSFFQTNIKQTKVLYRKIKELAKIKKTELVYDLYTGTGTIAQYIAKSAKKVVGIDSVKEGIEAAYENTKKNNISNCVFFTGDMKEIFSDEFITNNGSPDVIITDPPREGMHKKVVSKILEIGANRIIYVSCNSATQARDISLMKNNYKLTKIQPIDMFPQTHHVENILILEHI